ncbi:MAG TPA: hypothetical protein VNR68_05585 [Sphingomicrobium sp.]|nr:hypothetical protein [Sphingomicrobium sp.]
MRLLVLVLPLLVGGCVVETITNTAVDLAALPVKAASAGVDAVTTSQSEADEKRGRALRKSEESYGRSFRKWQSECVKLQRRGRLCPPRPDYVPPR